MFGHVDSAMVRETDSHAESAMLADGFDFVLKMVLNVQMGMKVRNPYHLNSVFKNLFLSTVVQQAYHELT